MSDFEGFPPATFKFLRDLTKNNNREWFAKNKTLYEEFFLAPSLRFIESMKAPLERAAPLLHVEAKKMGGSLMRIYKDTRFSKDKTPYKTNIGIHFRHQFGRDVHAPGVYFHLASDECFLGVGIWRPPSEAVKLIRQHISENSTTWRRLRKNKRFNEYYELHDERLKTAPKGFPRDHAEIEDLRLKSFIGLATLTRKQIQSPELVGTTVDLVRRGKPLMAFLCEALNQPY